MNIRSGIAIVALFVLVGSALAQSEGRRFRLIPLEEMTPEQRSVAEAIRSGPRASVPGSGRRQAAVARVAAMSARSGARP